MMGTVTISASFGTRGSQIGHAVAERLGLAFLDRAIPAAAARQLHLSTEAAENFDERAPTRWERLLRSLSGTQGELSPSAFSADAFESAESFRHATAAVLREVADSTGAVILGRAGMVVLAGRDDVLCVRLDGPFEARILQAIEDGAEEKTARQFAKDVDGARENYAQVFYNVRQNDPRLYHLILDSTVLPPETCVELIVTAAQSRFSGGQPAASS